ncbi:MAG: DUF2975 domain-containing protein [Pseudomonadota bacterium]
MTTTAIPNDWLLQSGRIGTIVFRALLWIVMAMLILALGFTVFADASYFAELESELTGKQITTSARIGFAVLVAVIILLLALAERLLQQLQRVVESVGAGDPFAPENAERLARMGWLLLASQCVAFLATTVTAFDALSDDWDFSGDFSVEGLFAVILLFILARVFKHGAAMREDLEGTV